MTETLEPVTDEVDQQEPAEQLLAQAKEQGVELLSLTAKGLTTGEVAAHFDDVYGAKVSKDTISRITDPAAFVIREHVVEVRRDKTLAAEDVSGPVLTAGLVGRLGLPLFAPQAFCIGVASGALGAQSASYRCWAQRWGSSSSAVRSHPPCSAAAS
jgi:hypothetical protein